MKFGLTFTIKKSELPVEYRRGFMSFIKATLNKTDEDLLEKFYHDTVQKPFCFSISMQKPKFLGDKVTFEGNKIKMYFSVTEENRLGYMFYHCFLAMKNVPFKLANGNEMTISHINVINQKDIVVDNVNFITTKGSSLVVREHNRETNKDRYYSIAEPNYPQKLEEIIKIQCKNMGFGEHYIEQIKVNNVVGKKIVIKHYKTLIDTTVGTVNISGPVPILNQIYKVGIGSRHSEGFGMVEVIY